MNKELINPINPIKAIRDRLGVSQKEFAIGIGAKRPTTISNYENWRRNVDIETAYKIISYANSKDKKIKTTLEHIYPPGLYRPML